MMSSPTLFAPTPFQISPEFARYQYLLQTSDSCALANHTPTADCGNVAVSATASDAPGDYDVVCGRGKGSYNRPGNRRFRKIVERCIPQYKSARTKLDKSMVLNSIVKEVRAQNNGTARFVKKTKGEWSEINDELAREKVGHAMREAISAKEAQVKKQTTMHVFENKQYSLLAQQKHLFEQLLSSDSSADDEDFE